MLLAAGHKPPDLLAHGHHLPDHRVEARLAAVARRDSSDAVGVVEHKLEQHAHDAASLAEGNARPLLLRRLGPGNTAFHFCFGEYFDLAKHFQRGRIVAHEATIVVASELGRFEDPSIALRRPFQSLLSIPHGTVVDGATEEKKEGDQGAGSSAPHGGRSLRERLRNIHL
jgi:hypothetical protein